MANLRLTDISLAESTAITPTTLIHVVTTADTSQYSGGSSYAGTLGQVYDGLSGYCVPDLYVSNLHSCSPLYINPLSEGDVYVGSANTVTIDLTNERFGIGTNSPLAKLDVRGASTAFTNNTVYFTNSATTRSWLLNDDGTVSHTGTLRLLHANNQYLQVLNVSSPSYPDQFIINSTGGASFSNGEVNIGSNGRVGINTAPGSSANLYVVGDTSDSSEFTLFTNNSSSGGLFTVRNDGRVGIGTSSQTAKLQINGEGSGTTTNSFLIKNSNDTTLLQFTDNGSFQIGRAYNSGYNNTGFVDIISPSAFSTSQRLSVGFDSKIYLNIDPLSITTVPAQNIHLGPILSQYYQNGTYGRTEVNCYDNSKNFGWIWDNPTGTTYLYSLTKTNSSTRFLTIDHDTRNLGLGTGEYTVPSANLHISGNSTNSVTFRVDGSGETNNFVVGSNGQLTSGYHSYYNPSFFNYKGIFVNGPSSPLTGGGFLFYDENGTNTILAVNSGVAGGKGVYGQSTGSGSFGVYGNGPIGVYGTATDSLSNYAGRFEGQNAASGIWASSVSGNYGVLSTIDTTITASTIYGVHSTANVSSVTGVTAVAGYFSATNGLNNYGILVPNGNVGIGTNTPSQKLEVNGTTKTTNLSATTITASTLNLNGSQVETAWTSYVPVWSASTSSPSIGDGTIEGYYKVIGKTCFVRGNIAMGSTTTFGSGEWYVSMPFTAKNADAILLTVTLLDNGSAWYNAIMAGARAGYNDKSAIQYQTTGGTASDVNATQPFTWANTDRFIWNGSYEIL